MHFTTAALLTLLGSVSAQKVHVVSVGSTNGTKAFFPDNLKADVGDMIQFQFRGGNHSVAQSNFDNPCTPINEHVSNQTGIFSGYQPVAAGASAGTIPTYTVMVSAKAPLWFYCSQAKHCQGGMVVVVNENTSANATRSLSNFKQLAKIATENVAPSTTTGGTTGSNGTTTGSTGGSTDSGSSSGSGSTTGSDSSSGSDSTGSDSASATESGAAGASSTAITTAGANLIGASSTLGLLGVAAALFML